MSSDYGMNTNRKRIGFWKKEDKESYLSSPIGFSEGKPVRMTLWPNFRRNDNTNQPYFFGLINDHFEFDEDVFDEDIDSPIQELLEMKKKVEKLAEVIREGRCNADIMMLPSESAARMNDLFKEAYQIIEELTGEKWEFTCITWG